MTEKTLTKAPVKNTASVMVTLAGPDEAKVWDKEVAPVLATEYPGRTQFGWRSTLRLNPLIRKPTFGLQTGPCYGLALYSELPADNVVLTGMLLVVENVIFPPTKERCLYVWFLQSAPDAYILGKGGVLLPKSGAVLLDAAIVASVNAGFEGRILLHADPSGGKDLMKYYANFGLASLDASLPVAITLKKNDGRYFYADKAIAETILKRNKR